MGRIAKKKKQLLKNLNGASNYQKWRDDCEKAKKELKVLTTRNNNTEAELKKARDELIVLRETNKQEKESHEATKDELLTSQEICRELEYRLERLQTENLQTTVSLEKSMNESTQNSSELVSANAKLERMRREALLNAKKTGEQFSEQRKTITSVSSERTRLAKSIEEQEKAQANRDHDDQSSSVLDDANEAFDIELEEIAFENFGSEFAAEAIDAELESDDDNETDGVENYKGVLRDDGDLKIDMNEKKSLMKDWITLVVGIEDRILQFPLKKKKDVSELCSLNFGSGFTSHPDLVKMLKSTTYDASCIGEPVSSCDEDD